jgi:hypothetical protein
LIIEGMFGEANPCLLGLAMNGMADGHWKGIEHVMQNPQDVPCTLIITHAISPCNISMQIKVGPWGIHESAWAFHARQTSTRHGSRFKPCNRAMLGLVGSIGHEDIRHATLGLPLVTCLGGLDVLVGPWGIQTVTSRLQ